MEQILIADRLQTRRSLASSVHGTTLATNAIIERKGAKTALVLSPRAPRFVSRSPSSIVSSSYAHIHAEAAPLSGQLDPCVGIPERTWTAAATCC